MVQRLSNTIPAYGLYSGYGGANLSHTFKLQSDAVRKDISQIINDVKEEKRNFTETIELHIGLKNYDPQKDKFTEKIGWKFMDVEALKKLNMNKKLVKKLAKKFHVFFALEVVIMRNRVLEAGKFYT